MELRPYQTEAVEAIEKEWNEGRARTLLVLPTGCGKTIVFCRIAENRVKAGDRVLILAHRDELLDQASDKLKKSTGLVTAKEKAEESCLGSWYRVTVGSVQSMTRENRLNKFSKDYFKSIIIDEAHHCLTDSYQRILEHFDGARVLGVTATPDRSDMRNLGQYFNSLAYEYTLSRAIREGYLCRIKAMTIPLNIDITGVKQQNGDFSAADVGTALDPYLDGIAAEMEKHCKDRRTVVFLPLIKTSQKMCAILRAHGFRAAEVNGGSADRAETLRDFTEGRTNVLCNSMLLTEGWDCPAVDCIVVLRPTKIRSLYCQMVGRGTRLSPATGKEDLLLLDFLWHTSRHELCRPAHLICESPEVADQMTKNLNDDPENAVDLEDAEEKAKDDVMLEREAALAKQLEEMRKRQRSLVDPLQFEMSINAEDLAGYRPIFDWQMAPPSPKQLQILEKRGIFPDEVKDAGMATLLIDRLVKRQQEGLTTPKQIRFLEKRGFVHVGTWTFDSAKRLIDRIAANNWRIPFDITPSTYQPELVQTPDGGLAVGGWW
ncbi:MAG: DEAD/DEAH box helicase [Bacteroidales bacterium]|nr:DEAD/DEAH box helicase [Bacteroidales bacterium]